MRHRREDVARLAIDGRDLPLAYGDLLVVHKDGTDPEWELQAVLLDDGHALEPAPAHVRTTLLDGSTVDGEGFVVRTQDRMVVLRGSGALLDLPVDDRR